MSKAAINSKYYVDHSEMYSDMWTAMDLREVTKEEVVIAESFAFDPESLEAIVESLDPSELTFRQRVKVLLGKEPMPLRVRMRHVAYELEEESIDTEELLAKRRWLLANDDKDYTPGYNAEDEAKKLLEMIENYPRMHNPDLVEALAKLPKKTELLIKLDRELSYEEKKKISNMVKSMVAGKQVSVRVGL